MMNIVIAIAFILPTLLFAAGAVAYCIERNLFRFRRTLSAFLGQSVFARKTVLPFPIADRVSFLPEARWNLIDGKASCFSYWLDGNGSLLLNWNNALVNRDVNTITNLQVELRRDGGFRLSSEDETHEFAPILSFDWDGDGLENSVDPEPLIADIDDAHGTNGEWLSTVCSNVFEIADGEINYKEDVNPNAYYFVNLVVERGPVSVTFQADRASRLGSPIVVARPGETNRVPLLAGIEYTVISREAFSLTVPEEYEGVRISITDGNPSTTTVGLPLSFSTEEVQSSQGRSYFVNVVPDNLDGEFHWNSTGDFLGRSSLFSHSSFCGCWTGFGNYISFNCYAACGCGGGCSADGRYSFEGADFDVSIGTCFCGPDFPHDGTHGSNHNSDEVFVSVGFNKRAVIFEDEYAERPGMWEPRHSTEVELNVSVYGGENGGTLELEAVNLQKLIPIACGPMMLPSFVYIPARESFQRSFRCEGVTASDIIDDVIVRGKFTDSVTGNEIDVESMITVIRVEFKPILIPSDNISIGRHTYGVCEYVEYSYYPTQIALTVNLERGGAVVRYQQKNCYQCPLFSCVNPFSIEAMNERYIPQISVLAPSGVRATPIRYVTYGLGKGKAGGIGMELRLYAEPESVSFSQIKIQEVVSFIYEASGYFTNQYFNGVFAHTGGMGGAGAGTWLNVSEQNLIGSYDTAAYVDEIPFLTIDGCVTTNIGCSWSAGHVYMNNPFGWGPLSINEDEIPYARFAEDVQNEFHLDTSGKLGIRKLYNQVSRSTNDVVYLNGVRME